MPVLTGDNKRLDHLGVDEITPKLVQLAQPEVVAAEVCIRARVWIASQIAEVLHQHKGAIEFGFVQVLVLGDLAQRLRTCRHVGGVTRIAEEGDGRRAIRRRQDIAGVCIQLIDKFRRRH